VPLVCLRTNSPASLAPLGTLPGSSTSRRDYETSPASFFFGMRNKLFASENPSVLYERHGTRLCAHALNPTMHRTRAANTATFNIASIMLPSTESTPHHFTGQFGNPMDAAPRKRHVGGRRQIERRGALTALLFEQRSSAVNFDLDQRA